jgi:hypothetical protein
MSESAYTFRSRPHLWLIRLIGVIVPRRLRTDWRQEWEAELNHREHLLAEWDRLDWRNKVNLLWRSTSAFWDAMWMQTYRLEDAMIQDLRYGLRLLLKNKSLFLLVAVLASWLRRVAQQSSIRFPRCDTNERGIADWRLPSGLASETNEW